MVKECFLGIQLRPIYTYAQLRSVQGPLIKNDMLVRY